MGFFSSGSSGRAADAVVRGNLAALQTLENNMANVREILKPFSDLGLDAGQRIMTLLTDPNEQKNFIENNPFFDALADRASDTLLNNQAAKGKVGSGGTAEALQNSLLLLGSDLLGQNINQLQNVFTTGSNSNNQLAEAQFQHGIQVANTRAGIGQAEAAGVLGKGGGFGGQLLSTGLGALGTALGGPIGGALAGQIGSAFGGGGSSGLSSGALNLASNGSLFRL